ncbi:MAG: amidohydrolase family protein [Gemmatimonadota bacterium]|nr:amidohydrolase family protein [Gemmatimonadota bacterium]MDE2873407.1 amidohydrolase family protein [Gemmatimonadota bacterium]
MTRNTLSVAALAALALGLPAPAAAQTYAITGGTVHTLAGETFTGTVVIEDGRIAAVGPDVQAPQGAEVVDATGRHVYPGMFDAVSRLGLTEIGAVDVTNDAREQGGFKPHLQAATAIHPATEHIPVARANGITLTMAAPQGGTVAGQASLIGLDGWTVEEMWIEPGAAMVINYPGLGGGGGFRFGRRGGGGGGGGWAAAQERHREAVDRLDEWFDAARRYDRAVKAGVDLPRDLKNEAMAKVVNREMPVLLSANGERNIRNAVEWAREQNIRFVITGGREAWKVADFLAENEVGVILSGTQAMPSGADVSYDEAYANPGKLHAAGVKIAFATFNSSSSRTLPYEAAQAVPYGLPHEAALAAVTRNAADMLGFGDRIGTIEEGKIANLMITDGDPLEIRTQVTDLFILGRGVSLDNRHKSLYEKYRARPRMRVIS